MAMPSCTPFLSWYRGHSASRSSQLTLLPAMQDFVKLAKWEDRGYYAMRASTEKAQRQLHRLSRRAEDALRQPFAALLAIAAKTMGFEDLASTGDGIRAEGVAGSAVEEGQSRLAALVLSSPATAPKRSKQVAAQGKGKAPDDAEVGRLLSTPCHMLW